MDFYSDIVEDGYHLFSLKKAKINGFYPSRFPDYPGVELNQLKVGDRITVRAFFPIDTGGHMQVDGGYIDLEIEHVESDHVFAVILTQLPEAFALDTGESIEVWEDEILYKKDVQEH
jgi:hypothetical protein